MITRVALISFTPDSGTLSISEPASGFTSQRGPGKYRVNIPVHQEDTTWYSCGGPAPSLAEALLDALDRLQAGGESAQTRAAGLSEVLAALEQGSVHVPSPLAQRVTQAFKDSLSDLVEESKRNRKKNENEK